MKDKDFWSHVVKTDTCWLWQRSRTTAGYGNYWSSERRRHEYAHIHAYEELVGLVPVGLQLDHSCFTENCVNPDHLTPVTQKKNGERRRGAPSNSTSGVRGVSWCKRKRRWRAYAVHNDKQYAFGLHQTKEAAEQAVIKGREKLYA